MANIGGNHYFNALGTFIKEELCDILNISEEEPRYTRIQEIANEMIQIRNNVGMDNISPFMNPTPNTDYQAAIDAAVVTINHKKMDLNSIRYGKSQKLFKSIIEETTGLIFYNGESVKEVKSRFIYYLFNNSIDLVMRKFLNARGTSGEKNTFIGREPRWYTLMIQLYSTLELTPYKNSFEESEVTLFDARYLMS